MIGGWPGSIARSSISSPPGSTAYPAGYFELEEQPPSTVELVFLGLLPDFIGQGLGGWLLTQALERAWSVSGTERVWLHTCSLDGPPRCCEL